MELLPKILENLLETLLAKNQVNNWNIYQENNGTVTVKIRIGGHNGGLSSGALNKGNQVSYKKKSYKQCQRDKNRAEQNNNKQGVITRSMSQIDSGIEQKRCMLDASIEKTPTISPVKFNDIFVSKNNVQTDDVSGSPVHSLPPDDSPSSVLNRQSPDDSMYQRNDNITVSPETSGLNGSVSDMLCFKSEELVDNIDNTDNKEDNSDMSEIKPEDDVELDVFCRDTRCAYGPGLYKGANSESKGDIFLCKARCKDLYICKLCYDAGGHIKHKKYLTIVTT